MSAPVATNTTTTEQWQGPVLDVVEALLAGHERSRELIAIFEKLVARNSELEVQLHAMMSRRQPGEGVSTDQLLLLLGGLSNAEGPPSGEPSEPSLCSPGMQEANDGLRAAAGFGEGCGGKQAAPAKPPPQPSIRKPFPEHLARVEHVIVVPQEQRPCPVCGELRQCIGHDVTEVADLEPAKVIVRVEKREKLACLSCEAELVRAPVGDRVVEGGRFGSRLVGQILVDKYDDGLPLHRQKQRLARMGLDVAVSTLADQITWVTELLAALWWAARRRMLVVDVLHVDGTGLPVLHRDPKTHKKLGTGKRNGTLWGYVGGDSALYLYCSTGHKTGQSKDDVGPEDFLKDRKGYTVADASNIFEATFNRADIIECACNMHARRYFVKALEGKDDRAALPIAGFKKLYDIEESIRGLDDEAKLKARQEESKPVYESLLRWCRVCAEEERPSSPLGKAAQYLLNHHLALMRFLEDARIPPDNGAVERLHVRAALTRKNFLFAGSDAGGRRAAIAYTVLGSCRLAGVNPEEYLADVLPRLARGVTEAEADQLLPEFWQRARAAGARPPPPPRPSATGPCRRSPAAPGPHQ